MRVATCRYGSLIAKVLDLSLSPLHRPPSFLLHFPHFKAALCAERILAGDFLIYDTILLVLLVADAW